MYRNVSSIIGAWPQMQLSPMPGASHNFFQSWGKFPPIQNIGFEHVGSLVPVRLFHVKTTSEDGLNRGTIFFGGSHSIWIAVAEFGSNMSGKNRYFMSDAGNEGLGSTATTTERIVPEVTEVFTVKLDGKKFSRIKPKFDRGQSKSWRTKGGPKPDRFPGKAPLDPVAVMRHSRGDGVKAARVKTKYGQKMAKRREELAKATEETAARTEFLLQEDAGYLVADDPEVDVEEFTGRISQESIRRSLVQQNQSASAEMGFELSLKQFGPYVTDYSRNGRSLLLGGRKGHIAALDWQQKKLKCEINVQDAVRDVKWLHTDSMFAVAQNRWTHIYDSQGIELHCLKKIDSVLKMEFLPYHFLLVTGVSGSCPRSNPCPSVS